MTSQCNWPISTGKTSFHHIEVLLIHIVCYYWGKEQLSLQRSTLYRGIEVMTSPEVT